MQAPNDQHENRSNNVRVLRVLLGNTHRPSYAETAPAAVHSTFNAAVLGTLVRTDRDFGIQPGLLKQWRWNFGERAYDLTLRDDITFHNGRRATAQDLEFSLLRGFFSKYRSFYRVYLSDIVGLEQADAVTEFRSGVVPGIQVTGPYSVRVRLSVPNPAFLYVLSLAYFSLVPMEALEPDYINWRTNPVGAGLYMVAGTGYADGTVVLQRCPDAPATAPERVELHTTPRAIPYDVALMRPPDVPGARYRVEYTEHPKSVALLYFNDANALAQRLDFRRAVQKAIAREALTQDAPGYTPTQEIIPRHFWGRTGLPESFDLAAARRLFEQLPAKERDQVWPVPVFAGFDFAAMAPVLDRLTAQLAAIGFRVSFYSSAEKFLSRETATASPLEFAGIVTDYHDPLITYGAFRATSPFEFQRRPATDTEYERLYQAARQAATPEAQRPHIQALSAYAEQVAMAVPLFEIKGTYYVNMDTVADLGEQNRPLYLQVERVALQAGGAHGP